ncbi:MAG: hypothetical protein IJT36_09710 [Alphaproteobacteria bacterium]|nr:hypothetical protein [Alphaproteobacteria bacterium]
MKLEGDYRFSISKKKSGFWKFDDDGGGNLDTTNIIPNYDASIRNKVSGYVVRVVCVYHF